GGSDTVAAPGIFWAVVSGLFFVLAVTAFLERRYVIGALEPFSRKEAHGKAVLDVGLDGIAIGVHLDGQDHTVVLHKFLAGVFATMLVVELVGFLAAMLAALV